MTVKGIRGRARRPMSGWRLYPAISKVALRCRSAICAQSGGEIAPPPSIVILELPSKTDGARKVDWARVVASAPAGAKVIVAGREPLESPDLDATVFEADRRGVHVTVSTYGAGLEEAAPVLYGLGVAVVRLNLHGPEDVHNRIAGLPHAYENAARGMLALKPLAYGASRPLLVAVIPVTRDSHARLSDAVECAFAMGVHRVTVRHAVPGDALIDTAALKAEMQKLRGRRAHGTVRFLPNLLDGEIERYYSGGGPVGPGRCFVPWRSVTVKADGTVRLCDTGTVGAFDGRPLGNIMNSESARLVRKALRKGLLASCEDCPRRFTDEDQLA